MHMRESCSDDFCIGIDTYDNTMIDAISLFCKVFGYLIRDVWFPSESEKIATYLSNGASLQCHRIDSVTVKLELRPNSIKPAKFFIMRFKKGSWFLMEQGAIVH